jgi:nondiscriminating glutamyl-tRNA synthetase
MGEGKIRVRFAPSPTGELHIGNARTALYNWLFARHHQGTFVLRIEDTDPQRSTDLFKANLLEDLHWLSIDWDEGPGKDGPYGPYFQSHRSGIYEKYLQILKDMDRVYPCYCTEAELEAERQNLLSLKRMPRYMGKCRNMSEEERQRLETEGRKPAYRFKVRSGKIEFQDRIRGKMQFDGDAIGDFIVMRSNGLPAYNFAVVVDDHLMKISHVIRGEDHLSNTASQLLLYEAFGFEPPQFLHHSLILGEDHTKLSKRHGAVSVGEFRRRGFLPEAVVNYLSILGSSFGEGSEIRPMGEIMQLFNIEKVGKGGAVFDEEKLQWMNAAYLRHYGVEKLRELILPILVEGGVKDLQGERLNRFIELVRPNMGSVNEISGYLGLVSEEAFVIDDEADQVLRKDRSVDVIKGFCLVLKEKDEDSAGELKGALKELSLSTGIRGKALYMPIRAAITGMTKGPELDALLHFMGRDFILKRLERVIGRYGAGVGQGRQETP